MFSQTSCTHTRACTRAQAPGGFGRKLLVAALISLVLIVGCNVALKQPSVSGYSTALATLEDMRVVDAAPATGYEREQFYRSWDEKRTCSTNELVLRRDLDNSKDGKDCSVQSGVLLDPYNGAVVRYKPGNGKVQIDHVVSLKNAWVTGAYGWSPKERRQFANDLENLQAVSTQQNASKGSKDASRWMPSEGYACPFAARQVMVKAKYHLWVTPAERNALRRELKRC